MSKRTRLWTSGVLAAGSFLFYQIVGYTPFVIAAMLGSAWIAGMPIFKKAAGALRYRIVGIDALVTIAVVGAVLIGEYWEACAVTFLFMLGDYLESRTIEKTRSSIKALLDLAPGTARVVRDGVDIEIDPQDVVPGDRVIVKPGEKIPVDGTVVEGAAYVNQSAITGESIPVSRASGETVFSGTIVESGYVIIRADQVGEDTTFSRILQLVEEAQDQKAKTQKFVEKFARMYTPAIMALSALTYLLTMDVRLALTLLVIACPGAFVIAVPVSVVAGIGNGARHGVLVKSGEVMERLGTIEAAAFDKTGTLTVGSPSVRRIRGFGMAEKDVLRLAAIGEMYSEHPLAKAVLREANGVWGEILEKPEDAEIIPGQGIVFQLDGKRYFIGNRKLMAANGMRIAEDIEEYVRSEEAKGQTAVILSDSEGVLGVISMADRIREDAAQMIAKLKESGIRKVVMLTGDNKRAAQAVARELGLDGYYAELLPVDKVEAVGELQREVGRTAMIGDGVNDAPALAAADVGIAIGGVGSDAAMETADVVLMSSEVRKLSHAVGLSRATVRNMKQNIVFALTVAFMLLIGVFMKTVHLSFGMLVHEASVLLVILNAIRLVRYGERRHGRGEEAHARMKGVSP